MSRCRRCGEPTIPSPVPDRYRGLLPGDPPVVGVCPVCLSVTPADDVAESPSSIPDLSDHSDALPSAPLAALGVVILVTLCESLAVNRAEILDLVDSLERSGVDPLLALDRLADDRSVDPGIDPVRRRAQLEQLLD